MSTTSDNNTTPSSKSGSSKMSFSSAFKEGAKKFKANMDNFGAKISESADKTNQQAKEATKKTIEALTNPMKMFNKKEEARRESHAVGTSANTNPGSQMSIAIVPDLPNDETIQKMDTILKKRLGGMTVEQFYNLIWKEHDFYTNWLKESGKDDIVVGSWDVAEGGPDSTIAVFGADWKDDTTKYGSKRTVGFQFTRTTHLYTGPPVAKVQQIHWSNLTDDRCIVHMQINMAGIPFANCFNVQIRWVATRIGGGNNALLIEVGLYVNFVEQTILAGKIRSGTAEETTKTQKNLLEAVLEECSKQGGDTNLIVLEEEEEEEIELEESKQGAINPCFGLPNFFHFFKRRRSDDAIGIKIQSIEHKLEHLMDLMDQVGDLDSQVEAKIDSELTDVQEALRTIDRHLKMARLNQYQSKRNVLSKK